MGLESFITNVEGISAEEAFNKKVEEDKIIYGTDGFGSDLIACSLGENTFTFKEFDDNNIIKAERFISMERNGRDYIADYIDLGIARYELVEVIQNDKACNLKFELRYIITSDENSEIPVDNVYYETIEAANDIAKKLAIDKGVNYKVRKKHVNVDKSINDVVTDIRVKVSEFRHKPDIEETSNIKIKEIHKYMFYGWGPY